MISAWTKPDAWVIKGQVASSEWKACLMFIRSRRAGAVGMCTLVVVIHEGTGWIVVPSTRAGYLRQVWWKETAMAEVKISDTIRICTRQGVCLVRKMCW